MRALLPLLLLAAAPAVSAALNCTDIPPETDAQLRDWASLAAFYNASGGPSWRDSECWDAARPRLVCDGVNERGKPASSWFGVGCTGDRAVEGLELGGNGLRGSLDRVLAASAAGGGLGALWELRLSGNSISGTMPPGGLWGLPALEVVDLSSNKISGPLQTSWLGTNVTSLNLGYNRLWGELSGEWNTTGMLESVHARGNALSGTFPSAWTGFDTVNFFMLHENRVSGQLPASYTGLGSLESFQMIANELTGTLPSAWSGLDSLSGLILRQNAISSTFPRRITGLPSLRAVYLSSSELEGTFPWREFERPGARQNLSGIDLSGTRISGELVLDSWGPGLADLRKLYLSESLVSGTLSGVAGPRAARLQTLNVADARLSGELPRAWTGLPRLHEVDLSGNRISGELPGGNLGFQSNLRLVRLASNELSGTVYVPSMPGRPPPQLLDLQRNRISGTLTPGLFFDVTRALLGDNLISGSLADMLPGTIPRPVSYILLAGNRLNGTIPAGLCAAGATGVDLSHNLLEGSVPACLGRAPGLVSLNLASNRLSSISRGFVGPDLVTLSLARNRFADQQLLQPASSPDAGGGDGASLRTLDLSFNEVAGGAEEVITGLTGAHPNLASLRVRGCSLSGGIGSLGAAPPATLDLAENPAFQGFNPAVIPYPLGLEFLNVTQSAFSRPLDNAAGVRSLSRVGVSQSACLPRGVLESDTLEHVDAGSAPFRASCLARTLRAIRVSGTGSRFFPDAGGLACPAWVTRASGADVLADMDFSGFERCECPAGRVWDAATRACAPCPDPRRDTLVCDPFVLAPRHCLLGERYAVAPGGEAPRTVGELLGAATVACRRPGVCNPAAGECAARQFLGRDHTHANRSGAPAPACADGHEGFLCSRCSPGRWRSGDSCLPCHDAFAWLVPLTMLAMLAGAVAFLWRMAGRTPDGSRALAIALFWLQLSSLLEASSQVQAGNESTSTWQWLATAEAAAQSWAVVQPWAAQCVSGGLDFVGASLLLLAAPAVVAAVGAAAAAASPPARARRVRFVAAYLLLSLFLPSVTRALQAFPCEAVPGTSHSFLTAAPYVRCDGSGRLSLLRAAAGLSLALYAMPLAVAVVVQLRRARSRRGPPVGAAGAAGAAAAAAAAAACEMDLPLLGAEPGGDGGGEQRAEPSPHAVPLVDLLLTSTLRDPDGMWWWPAAYDIGRGVALAAVVGLLPPTSPLLPVFVFAVLAAAAVLQARFRPARRGSDNTLESVVLLAAMSTYLLNISSGASAHRGFATESSAAAVRGVMSVVRACMLALLAAAVARASSGPEQPKG